MIENNRSGPPFLSIIINYSTTTTTVEVVVT